MSGKQHIRLPHKVKKHLPFIFYSIGTLLYAAVFFKNAWVSDDAFIIFRSLEQLLDGNGPRWNPHERVQVFTSPLWYSLLAVMGFVHRNHYLNSILLSAACNAVLLWNLHKLLGSAWRWLALVILLAFSQAFFDFTSSGLENPLAYCLLSFAVRFYLLPTPNKLENLNALCIACGLLLVTRHDLLLFVIPLLMQSLYDARKTKTPLLQPLCALLLPLTAWSLFSLIYYGFPLPNTAYAKLASSVPRTDLLLRGALYFKTSVPRDFISIFLLLAGILAGLLGRNSKTRLIAAGVALHLCYVFWIGGDFMRGRFFSWDCLLCAILLTYPATTTTTHRLFNRDTATLSLATLAAITSMTLWQPPLLTPFKWGAEPFRMADTADGITQERYFYYWFTAAWKYFYRDTPLLEDHGWCQDSFEQKRQGLHVSSAHTVGFRGYCLGNDDIVIDMLGITDPLLARMTRNPRQKNWRPGHMQRLLPPGYCTSVQHDKNLISDAETAAYYEKIRLLTQSEKLFTTDRLRTIWQMNTGAYNSQLENINNKLHTVFLQADGPGIQAAALRDCPGIELPPEMIEKLKRTGETR